MKSRVYFYANGRRRRIGSLRSYIKKAGHSGFTMEREYMDAENAVACPWLGYGIGKGITSPTRNISVFATPHSMQSGLHSELIRGFRNLDPFPLCYESRHKLGFADFVRWVYLCPKTQGGGIVGIDWSLVERPTAGVATSMKRVGYIAKTLVRHGISHNTTVALLNSHMCEEAAIRLWRESLGLRILNDWVQKSEKLFGENGLCCPRCGQQTRSKGNTYCTRCGGKFNLLHEKGGCYVLEK